MKKILFLLVIVFFSCLSVHGQMATATFDATLNAFMAWSHFENIVYYGQMVASGVEQIEHFKTMLEKTGKQIELSMQNLRSLKDVDSWDSFMDFYNRQLYYERMAEESVKGMNVSIGKKNYSLWDLEGIRNGLTDTYVDYWDKEFTEEQRREMWLGLGLSPSNYAYVQPYRQKGLEVSRILLSMSDIQNKKNIEYSEANKKDMDDLAEDSKLPEEEQMGQKAVGQRIWQVLIRNNEILEDLTAITAKRAEMDGIDKALEAPLQNQQQISNWDTGFVKLKK